MAMAEKSTIHILGAGALGSLWATKLSSHNNVILLVKRGINHNQAINYHAFQFIEQNQTTFVSLPCEHSSPRPHDNAPIDTLLVFTKSYDTLQAVKQLKSRITPLSRIVLFQNGMGSQQEITHLLPHNTVYAASTTEGANRPDQQTIVYAGKGETWVGSISKQQNKHDSDKVSNLLSSSGLDVSYNANIWEKLWLKLAINCAINPFTALLNCKNGELIGKPLFDNSIAQLCSELAQAMKLNQFEISADELHAIVKDVIKKTASNVSSMLQDVRAGKKTEIEYINGYIEMVAQTSGLTLPTNLKLLEEVRERF